MTTSIQKQSSLNQTDNQLDETFLDEIERQIHDGNTEEAFANIYHHCLYGRPEEKNVRRIYFYLHQLIPYLNSAQIGKFEKNGFKLLDHFQVLYNEQKQLALDLGGWHLKQADSLSFDKRLSKYLQAMPYYAKAIQIAEMHNIESKELHFSVSKIFMRLIHDQLIESENFQKRLDRARREANPDKFQKILNEIDILKQYQCEKKDHDIIKKFYINSRDILNEIPEASIKKFECFSPLITKGLGEKVSSIPEIYITQKYRKELQKFRENFEEKFKTISSEIDDFETVKKFQHDITDEFSQLLRKNFFDHAFAFLGPPPCSYDIRVMGSFSSNQFCPFSDMEWMILIEKEEHIEYFKKFAQVIELQIISLGETAVSDFPVFKSTGEKHKSGFHVDSGGNPAISDLIKTPEKMAALQHPSPGSDDSPHKVFHSLRKTRSIMCNDSTLFNTYEKEMQKILNETAQNRALALLKTRIEEYKKLFNVSLEKQTIINLKEQFVQLINYTLNDLALYYNISEVNTFDIIDALVKKDVFSPRSGKLIKEAASAIYMTRIRLHFQYKEQKEEALFQRHEGKFLLLSGQEKKALSRIYWLVLLPLYKALEEGLEDLKEIDLLERAFYDEIANYNEETPKLHTQVQHSVGPYTFAACYQACRRGNIDDLRLWIKQNPKRITDVDPNNGATYLHAAASEGHLNIIRFIHSKAPFLLKQTVFGNATPLDLAKEAQKEETVKLLKKLEASSASEFKEEEKKESVAFPHKKGSFHGKIANYNILVQHFVSTLIKENAFKEEHERHYRYLSYQTFLDPLRDVYIQTLRELGQTKLIAFLAPIRNPSGLCQSYFRELRGFQNTLFSITTKILQEGKINVTIKGLTSENFYLTQEVIKQILDENGDIKRQYKNSLHNVARAYGRGFDFHFKQKPSHPTMEYAIHAFISRIMEKGTPFVKLIRFEVEINGKKKVYPVLISETIQGETLAQNPNPSNLDLDHLTWSLICNILTRPGDERDANCVLDNMKRIFRIDNDISFVEPIIQGKLWNTIQFCAILFCLDRKEMPLNKEAMNEFIALDPGLIIYHWLEDVIQKEKEHIALFTEKERKQFYEEDPEKAFTPSLLFREGTIMTLCLQFYHLQEFFKEKQNRPIYPTDLLSALITLRQNSPGKNLIGPLIERAYKRACEFNLPPKERLEKALEKSMSRSMTTPDALGATLGNVPKIEQIENKQFYSPEKAKEELFFLEIQKYAQNISLTRKGGIKVLHANFGSMQKDGKPDIERQNLVLKGLIMLIERDSKNKPQEVTFSNCAILDRRMLSIFLHDKLTYLDLCNCPKIDDEAVREISKKAPYLKELHLNKCDNLFEIAQFHEKNLLKQTLLYLWDGGRGGIYPIEFSRLEIFSISFCGTFNILCLKAPSLRELKLSKNQNLTEIVLTEPSLTTKIKVKNCPKINLWRVKNSFYNIKFPQNPDFYSLLIRFLYPLFKDINEKQGDEIFGYQLWIELQKALDDENRERLFKELKADSSISHININAQTIDFHRSKLLESILRSEICCSIRSFSLSNCAIGKDELIRILDALNIEAKNFLASTFILNLANNKIKNDKVLGSLEKFLIDRCFYKKIHLDLSNNQLDRGFPIIGPLASLNLSKNNIKYLRDLVYLKENRHLTHLYLSQNQLSYCEKELDKTLEENTVLENLDLSHNEIKNFGSFLKKNESLASLNLAFNNLGRRNLFEHLPLAKGPLDILANALKDNSTLTHLDLSYNGIDICVESKFLDLLRSNSSLTFLDLRGNFNEPVKPSPSKFPHLPERTEDMQNSFGWDALQALRRRRPSLEIKL